MFHTASVLQRVAVIEEMSSGYHGFPWSVSRYRQAYIDASYSLDAPSEIPAGSHLSYRIDGATGGYPSSIPR